MINVTKLGGKFFRREIIKNFVNIFLQKETNDKTFFVVSAMEGITRLLHLLVDAKTGKVEEGFITLIITLCLDEFHRIHLKLIYKLFNNDELNKVLFGFDKIFIDLKKTLEDYKNGDNEESFHANVVKFGELVSSYILFEYLDYAGVDCQLFDARDYVVSNNDYKNGKVLEIKSFKNLFQKSKVLLTQGFISRNTKGEDTLLGLDGSDTSASEFAIAFKNEGEEVSLTFAKDVRGFFKEDPNKNPNAEISKQMHLIDYLGLSSHPIRKDAVKMAFENGISVSMKYFIDLEESDSHIVI